MMSVSVQASIIKASLDQVSRSFVTVWPLQTFIACNPLLQFEDRSFFEALNMAERELRWKMPEDFSMLKNFFQPGSRPYYYLRLHLEEYCKAQNISDVDKHWGNLLASLTSTSNHNILNSKPEETWLDEQMVKWCACYLDRGQAVWAMPNRKKGFFKAWKQLVLYDNHVSSAHRKQLKTLFKTLPRDSYEAIVWILNALGIESPKPYFMAHLARLPGWVGYMRWFSDREQEHVLADYILIRLCYEWALGLRQEDLPAAIQSKSINKLQIFVTALEASYQEDLLSKLSQNNSVIPKEKRLLAQAVFCIDVRSEPLRRSLETLGHIETFGFAGFFGIPIRFKPYGEEQSQDLCPVLLKPRYEIEEVPVTEDLKKANRQQLLKGVYTTFTSILLGMKKHMTTTFGYVETLGIFHVIPMISKTFMPITYNKLSRFAPSFNTRPLILPEAYPEPEYAGMAKGISLAEQVYYAEITLTVMGLKDNFRPFVLLCGHGAQVDNNPYASALDCVACGGHHGEANARLLAEILNNASVRDELVLRGIHIPPETLFLSAEHNTVTDEITITNLHQVPFKSRDDLAVLIEDFKQAAALNCKVRKVSLDQSDLIKNTVDWSQIRPEWATAGNGAFIAAPRSLTEGVDLGGRAFLHSYDWQCDTDGNSLEVILTAPLIVAQWINMQYFFSALDNVRFGSGTKVLHNVVGQFGTMLGNAGDLQIGLPLQSVMRVEGSLYHEPVRLTVIVMAPLGWLEKIIYRHSMLQNLFNNEWVSLMVLDPHQEAYHRYKPGGGWQRLDFNEQRSISYSSPHV